MLPLFRQVLQQLSLLALGGNREGGQWIQRAIRVIVKNVTELEPCRKPFVSASPGAPTSFKTLSVLSVQLSAVCIQPLKTFTDSYDWGSFGGMCHLSHCGNTVNYIWKMCGKAKECRPKHQHVKESSAICSGIYFFPFSLLVAL